MTTGLGAWLRVQRTRKGLTQAALAAKVGRPQTWVSQVERGEVRLDADEAAALAYFVEGSVLDALDQGGYLAEPLWVRSIEAKLDTMHKALHSA